MDSQDTVPIKEEITPVKGLSYFLADFIKPDNGNLTEVLDKFERLNACLLDNLPYAITIISRDTSLKYINPAMSRLTGFPVSELLGQKAPYPYWPSDRKKAYLDLLNKMIREGVRHIEIQLSTRDRNSIWVEITLIPFVEANWQYYIFNHIDITERRRMREETEFYVRQLTRVQEEERQRIARELHDDTAQYLAYVALELDSLIHNPQVISAGINQRLNNLKRQVDISLKEVRRFSHELRPGVLDQLGLIAALEMLVDESNERGQVSIKFNVDGAERRLSNEEELALFRIAQEALSNIRKHSRATQAEVSLNFTSRKVNMAVSDNGRGFPATEMKEAVSRGRLGLIGMKERAHLIGGSLEIISAPREGTKILVEVEKNS